MKKLIYGILGINIMFNTSNASFNDHKVGSKEYGVYFLIEKGKVLDKAKEIADKHGSSITPHITVLQSVFSEDTVKKVQKILKSWSEKQQTITIRFRKKIERGGGGNTFWNVEDSKKLHEVNTELTEVIDPLRDGILKQVQNNMDNFSPEELANIKKYGRHFNVPGVNHPHITVAYGTQDEKLIQSISSELELFEAEHQITSISFGEIDQRGNIVKTLYTHRFGK